MKFRSQIENQVSDYTSWVFIMPCLLYYVSLYGVCFSSSGPKIRPCRLSVNFLYPTKSLPTMTQKTKD